MRKWINPFLCEIAEKLYKRTNGQRVVAEQKMMIFVQIKLIRRNRKRENEVGVFCETLYKFNKNNGMIIP